MTTPSLSATPGPADDGHLAPAGWYAAPWDPQGPRCYWDGACWTYRPGRRPDDAVLPVAPERAAADAHKVTLWYSLTFAVPFALALVVPFFLVLVAPRVMSESQLTSTVWGAVATGWVFFAVAALGRAEGTVVDAESPEAARWRSSTRGLTWALAVWGLVATMGLLMVMVLAIALGSVGAGL